MGFAGAPPCAALALGGCLFCGVGLIPLPRASRCISNGSVPITLRDVRDGEFQLLWQLDQECFPRGIAYSQRELRQYMDAPATFTIVAEANATKAPAIAGFLVGQRHKRGLGHVVTIDVNPRFRREGVGTLLMQAAEQRLHSEGCHAIFLETAVDNSSAISFYKRLGYSILRTLPRYYMGDLDAFLMGKSLVVDRKISKSGTAE
jgi:[ribosomal protein S18]-alanine N-acetyltransferase